MDFINDFFDKYYKDKTVDEVVKDYYYLEKMLTSMATKIVTSIEYPTLNPENPIVKKRINQIKDGVMIKGLSVNDIKRFYLVMLQNNFKEKQYSLPEESYPIVKIEVMLGGVTTQLDVTLKKDGTLSIPFGVKYDEKIVEQIVYYNQLIRNNIDVPKYNYYEELLRPFEETKKGV